MVPVYQTPRLVYADCRFAVLSEPAVCQTKDFRFELSLDSQKGFVSRTSWYSLVEESIRLVESGRHERDTGQTDDRG